MSDETAQLTVVASAFLDACRSSNTRSAYEADLATLAAWCRDQGSLNLLTVDVADLARYRTACELAGASPATVARRLSAMASFAAFASSMGESPALAPGATIDRPALESRSTATLLADADADALLGAAERLGARAGALIRLLMLDGLKVGEVIRADTTDVSRRGASLRLRIHDRRSRTIELHPDTASALSKYLVRRRSGPLILSEQRGRDRGRLTRFGVDYLVKRVAREAGLAQPISGNTLRRRYVVAAHDDGIDLELIRHNTGHGDRRTARRYLEPDVAASDQSRPQPS
jgi:integrase/recombinase XerD